MPSIRWSGVFVSCHAYIYNKRIHSSIHEGEYDVGIILYECLSELGSFLRQIPYTLCWFIADGVLQQAQASRAVVNAS